MTSSGASGGSDSDAERGRRVPPRVDMSRPNPARVYDLALGGKDNYAVDRELYEQVVGTYPTYPACALANRRFMARAVRLMAHEGITQYLDLGTGIPTSPNVHEVARETHPGARVAYVDIDPVVSAHADALLARHDGVVAVRHDATQVEDVLADPAVRCTIDLTRPVGLLCTALLHFVSQDRARAVLSRYRAALAPGSYLALSTFRNDPTRMEPRYTDTTRSIADSMATRLVFRTEQQIAELFDGFELLEPGLLDVGRWTIGEGPDDLFCSAGIGRLG